MAVLLNSETGMGLGAWSLGLDAWSMGLGVPEKLKKF